MLKLKLQYFSHLLWRADSLEKTLLQGKIEGKKRQGQQRMRWHHQLNGPEFEQALGDGDEQGSLECYSPCGHKESDRTEWLNNNNNSRANHCVQEGAVSWLAYLETHLTCRTKGWGHCLQSFIQPPRYFHFPSKHTVGLQFSFIGITHGHVTLTNEREQKGWMPLKKITFLLRCNSQTIKYTLFNCTVLWFSVYSQSCSFISSIWFWEVFITPKWNLMFSSSCSITSPCPMLIYFLSLQTCLFQMLHTMCGHSWLASFNEHNDSKVIPVVVWSVFHSFLWWSNISVYGFTAFCLSVHSLMDILVVSTVSCHE